MFWLTSSLIPLFVLGLILALGSRLIDKTSTLRSKLLGVGLMLMAVAAGGLAYVALGPPGGEDTVEQPDGESPRDKISQDLLTRLTTAWDANADADWPVAETMAVLSETAYLTPVEADAKFRTLGFKEVGTIVDASMVGYVLVIEDAAVVVFRGTDDASDWVVNLKIAATNTTHGGVHRGFHLSYQPLKPQIQSLLSRAERKHLWITGHSLGGALAVLCAYDLIENQRREVAGVMTFGQPMVARPKLAAHLDSILSSRFAHFVNESDVVPRIPPSYRHCGSLVWYKNGTIRRSRPNQPLPATSEKEAPDSFGANEVEVDPLSREEFRALQAQLKVENAAPPDVIRDDMPQPQGSSPLIQDHAIALYVEKIRLHLHAE